MSYKLYGINPIFEALKARTKSFDKIMIAKGRTYTNIERIIQIAKQHHIQITFEHKETLDRISEGANHQGIIAFTGEYRYHTLDYLLSIAEERNEKKFILILDHIEDPHNLGALIRTAHSAGVHGVVIPELRAANVTETVSRTSAGAIEHTPIVKVTNIHTTILALKNKKVWIVGAEASQGKSLYDVDFDMDMALVIGSEGKGVSRLVKESCDFLVSIPMKGQVSSLNASVSGAVLMYEVLRQRRDSSSTRLDR